MARVCPGFRENFPAGAFAVNPLEETAWKAFSRKPEKEEHGKLIQLVDVAATRHK
jgi:hypothetical protein